MRSRLLGTKPASRATELAMNLMVVFNDPVPVDNPALPAVLMAFKMRDTIGA
jgi:hypothetical protein